MAGVIGAVCMGHTKVSPANLGGDSTDRRGRFFFIDKAYSKQNKSLILEVGSNKRAVCCWLDGMYDTMLVMFRMLHWMQLVG